MYISEHLAEGEREKDIKGYTEKEGESLEPPVDWQGAEAAAKRQCHRISPGKAGMMLYIYVFLDVYVCLGTKK
jgi:hypothetical protein